jgi:hypothetical protein
MGGSTDPLAVGQPRCECEARDTYRFLEHVFSEEHLNWSENRHV